MILAIEGDNITTTARYGATAVCHSLWDLQFFLDTLELKQGIADVGTRLKVALGILQQTRGVY
jgi:hypothetical protein